MLIEIEKVDYDIERMRQNLWTFRDNSGNVPWYWHSWSIIATSEEALYCGCEHWFGRDKRSCEVLQLIPTKICKQEIPSPFSIIFNLEGEALIKDWGCIYMDERYWKNPDKAVRILPRPGCKEVTFVGVSKYGGESCPSNT